MWLFTPIGFFSTVSDVDRPGHVIVRARCREDLVQLKAQYLPELSAIQTARWRDYMYRAYCTTMQYALAVGKIALDIEYSNFKEEVSRRQGAAREHLYEKVWLTMLDLQPDRPWRYHLPPLPPFPTKEEEETWQAPSEPPEEDKP